MRWAFVIAFSLGFLGVLAAGYFVPWAEHERVASKTSVAMNGGRRETFLIYLPADRLAEAADMDRFPLTAATTVRLPGGLAATPLLAEHFKLRDADGNVIGLATRHWSDTTTGAASVWAVNIPSRGSLVLASEGEVGARLATALSGAGVVAGGASRGEVEVAVAAETASRVVVGTEEFEGVGGRYAETWRVSGFNERGELQGTIVIDTVVNQT